MICRVSCRSSSDERLSDDGGASRVDEKCRLGAVDCWAPFALDFMGARDVGEAGEKDSPRVSRSRADAAARHFMFCYFSALFDNFRRSRSFQRQDCTLEVAQGVPVTVNVIRSL